jgi:U3 small nucleolar RNA-associated protein 19
LSFSTPCTLDLRLLKMPTAIDKTAGSKKRKSTKENGVPSSKRRAVAENESTESMARILELEEQISESRKHYNNIATLISMLSKDGSGINPDLAVAVSLCRVFSRLIAGGNLTEASNAAENEKIVVAWLRERCREYQRLLVSIMRESDASSQVGFCAQ